jgi:large subunit ribosomal protein L2
MGKRILQQRRGKGGSQYRAPTKGKKAIAKYPFYPLNETHKGEVISLFNERGRSAPVAKVKFEDELIAYLPAVSGLFIGSKIEIGPEAEITTGNILPLMKIPEGTNICNIENSLGDGGKFVKASGGSAVLFSKTVSKVIIKLPSGISSSLNNHCRASIGVIAGEGRYEKPFLKAGARFHVMKSKGKIYPRVRGVAMAAVHHPFGGGRHQSPHKSTATSRFAPPGRKVGHIAPRKTGRKRITRKMMEARSHG